MGLLQNIPIIGPAISGVQNIVGTVLQNRANRKLAEYEYSKNLEMWNKQNQYNTPSAQMQRYKEAGLNPNLIYGQGTPGNASSMAHYQAPTVDYKHMIPDAGQMIGQYQDIQLRQAQIDNAKAQNKMIQAETILKLLEQPILTARGKWQDLSEQARLELLSEQMKNISEQRVSNIWQNRFLEDTYSNKVKGTKSMFERYQYDVQAQKLENAIKELNLKYMRWGSPAWNTGTNLIRLMLGR